MAKRKNDQVNGDSKPDFRRKFFSGIGTLNKCLKKAVEAEKGDLTSFLQDYKHYVGYLEDRYLKKPGQVYMAGNGDCGQLGLGLEDEDKSINVPTKLSLLQNSHVTMVACGGLHNVACTAEGKVLTWGCNDDGSLGRITTSEEEETFPSEIELPEPITQVAAGDCQSLALGISGKVYSWGCHKDKEGKQWHLKNSRTTKPDSIKQIQKEPMEIPGLSNVVEIRCTASVNIALTNTGSLISWGIGECFELGRPVCQLRNDKDEYDYEGIRKDHLTPGPMFCNEVSTDKPAEETVGPFKAIGCGAYHVLAVSAKDCEVYVCGLNNYGQLGLGDRTNRESLTKVKALDYWGVHKVTGGAQHSLVLCNSGAVLSFGRTDYGQLGVSGADKAAGGYQVYPRKVEMPKEEVVLSIAAGTNHSLCITKNRELYAWGFGDNGALALGDSEEDQPLPKKVKFNGQNIKVAFADGGGTHTAIIG